MRAQPFAPHLLGADGEDLAARWYRDHGFHVIARNWRTSFGELDLIARQERLLVVAEVKTRATAAFGSPAHAVGATKQQRIRRLTAAWLAEHGHVGRQRERFTVRFDVVAIVGTDVDVFPNAF